MERPPTDRSPAATIFVVAVLVSSPWRSLLAQEAPPPADQPVTVEPHADEQRPDVYLNDSFEAVDALGRAADLAKAGRWPDAAALLDRTSIAEGEKLIRHSSGRYGSVRDHINSLIAGWPPPALTAYRDLVGAGAEKAFARAGERRDVSELVVLFDRFFCTRLAAEAAGWIGQSAIEAGDFDLAVFVYQRVLTAHPDRKRFEREYGAMFTIARALRGEDVGVEPDVEHAGTLRWFGQDRSVPEILEEVRRHFTGPRVVAPAGEWPVFGGSYRRSATARCSVEQPGLVWRYRFRDARSGQSAGAGIEMPGRSSREAARDLTVFPVASEGIVVAQRFRTVVALHRNTGALAWRFSPDALPAEPDNYLEDRPPGWNSVTVQQGRVYAALPPQDVSYYDYNPGRSGSELVCIDLRKGDVLWRTGASTSGEFASELRFDSSPLVENDRIFLVARRRRSFGFEDCYLYRFRALDGRFLGRIHLGSASVVTFGSRTATSAIAAMHQGTIFVNSGLGTIAAVSAYTGNIRWLVRYERLRSDDGAAGRSSREVRPWQFNPVIYQDNRIYALPTDSAALLVLDPDDGSVLEKISIDRLGEMSTLLGVRNGVACGVGNEIGCFDLAARSPRWTKSVPESYRLFGRGAWTDEALILPLRDRLVRFPSESGAAIEHPWEVEGEGGNLLLLGELLIVAGTSEIAAYAPKEDIWRSLRERMRAAPDDPLPAIELAEVAIGAGEHEEALAVLDETVARLARISGGDTTAVQTRLFNDVCKFALVLLETSHLDDQTLDRLHTFASRFAPDLGAGLKYRREFATLYERRGDPGRAVHLYHQILRDRSLRELPIGTDGHSARTAAAFAADNIAELIEKHGRAIYTELEAEAQRWFEGANRNGHQEPFVRLIETFPNSTVAPRAMVAYGRWLMREGRFDEAVKQLTLAYHRLADRRRIPDLMREIADAHEQAGSPEHAFRWLTKAMRDFPSFQLLHQGKRVTFKTYRRRLESIRDRVIPILPDPHLPLVDRTVVELPEGGRVLSPAQGARPGSDWTTLLVATPDALEALDAATGKRRWSATVPGADELQLFCARGDVILLKTPYQVWAIDPTTGEVRWKLGEIPPHVNDPHADWENGGALRSVVLEGDRLVVSYDSGEMNLADLAEGRIIWARKVEEVPSGRVRMTDPYIAYHLRQGEHVKLVVLDARSGQLVGSTLTSETAPVEAIFITIDGRVVMVTSQSVTLFDASTLKQRWRFVTGGLIRGSSILLDLDALYLSDNGRTLTKLRLGDGRECWRSEELVTDDKGLRVQQAGGSLIVTTIADVVAVDAASGLTLWRGTTPERPKLMASYITASYVLVVDVSGRARGQADRAYFYDHRNASGLIPKGGGAIELTGPHRFDPPRLPDQIPNVFTTDAGLAVQTGKELHLLTSAPRTNAAP